MANHKNQLGHGLEDEKLNKHLQSVLGKYPDSADVSGMPIDDNPRDAPPSGQHPDGPMKGPLMNWTQLLEAMDQVSAGIDAINNGNPDIESQPIEVDTSAQTPDEKVILDKLNKIFTPILVMQGFENDINAQKIQESYEQAGCLTERNIIQFDDATRMAQLISTCAILLQQAKNTEKYQLYAKAAAIRNQMKLDMQKEEYEAAKALAQKYLVMVSTTNNSPIARDAATSLLPQTQH